MEKEDYNLDRKVDWMKLMDTAVGFTIHAMRVTCGKQPDNHYFYENSYTKIPNQLGEDEKLAKELVFKCLDSLQLDLQVFLSNEEVMKYEFMQAKGDRFDVYVEIDLLDYGKLKFDYRSRHIGKWNYFDLYDRHNPMELRSKIKESGTIENGTFDSQFGYAYEPFDDYAYLKFRKDKNSQDIIGLIENTYTGGKYRLISVSPDGTIDGTIIENLGYDNFEQDWQARQFFNFLLINKIKVKNPSLLVDNNELFDGDK